MSLKGIESYHPPGRLPGRGALPDDYHKRTALTSLGSMIFRRNVTGARVVLENDIGEFGPLRLEGKPYRI
jgi:hypothetical protein